MLKAFQLRRGFTLIELLVVLAIIVILAGLILSTIAMTQEKSRQMSCKNNLKQIGFAIKIYATDFQLYPGLDSFVAGAPPEGIHTASPMNYIDGGGQNHASNTLTAWGRLSGTLQAAQLWCPSAMQSKKARTYTDPDMPFSTENISYTMVVNQTEQYSSDSTLVSDVIKVADPSAMIVENHVFIDQEATPQYNHKGQGINNLYGDFHVEFISVEKGLNQGKSGLNNLRPTNEIVGYRWVM